MFEKVMKGIQRRLKEARRGAQLICSDLLQNWLAAGVVCPIKLRSILYRLAGNKIGKNCYLSWSWTRKTVRGGGHSLIIIAGLI